MKKSITIIIGFLLLQFSTGLFAISLTGHGINENSAVAKKLALADLAKSVQVRVEDNTEICQQSGGNAEDDCNFVKQSIHTETDIPLMGVIFKKLEQAHNWEARLDSNQALPLYLDELKQRISTLIDLDELLKKTSDKENKFKVINKILPRIRSYHKHRLVAFMLGAKNIRRSPVNETALLKQLLDIESTADSIAFAARLLTKDLKKQWVYIHPPRHRDAKEITPFASAIKDQLASIIKPVHQLDRAEYTMNGQYQILDNGDIHLTYQLLDKDFETQKVSSVRIIKKAYKGFRAEPLAADFDALLHQKVAVSNEFRSEITTSQGSRDLLIKNGENIKLVVRLNKAGYIYIVGHVVRKEEQFSYLLPLQDAEGDDAFVRYIPPDQVNRYVDLGEFEVEPPFGVEHLQLIASNKGLRNNLPSYQWNDLKGYFVLNKTNGNALKGIVITRGLKPKWQGNKKVREKTLSHESILTFTTLER